MTMWAEKNRTIPVGKEDRQTCGDSHVCAQPEKSLCVPLYYDNLPTNGKRAVLCHSVWKEEKADCGQLSQPVLCVCGQTGWNGSDGTRMELEKQTNNFFSKQKHYE